MGGGTVTLVQNHYRFQDDGSDANTSTLLGTEDVSNNSLSLDTTYFLRIQLQNEGTKDQTDGYELEYKVGAGSYTLVSTTSSNVRAVAGSDTDNDPITSRRLSDDGDTFQNGEYSEDGQIASFTLVQGQCAEVVFAIQFRSADLTAGSEQIDLRVVYDNAGTLDRYDVTAEATMPSAATNVNQGSAGSVSLADFNVTIYTATDINAATTDEIEVQPKSATITINPTIDATLGTLNATAYNATILAAVSVDCTLGTISLAKANATIYTASDVSVGLGLVNTVAQNATIYTATEFAATTGTVNATTLDATILTATDVSVGAGAVTTTAFNATVTLGVSVDVGVGAVNATAYDATILAATSFTATSGTVNASPFDATVLAATDISSGIGAVNAVAYDATVEVSTGTDVDATLGTVSATALDATVLAGTDVDVTLGAVNTTALNPSVLVTTDVNATLGEVSLAPKSSTILRHLVFDVEAGAVAVVGWGLPYDQLIVDSPAIALVSNRGLPYGQLAVDSPAITLVSNVGSMALTANAYSVFEVSV